MVPESTGLSSIPSLSSRRRRASSADLHTLHHSTNNNVSPPTSAWSMMDTLLQQEHPSPPHAPLHNHLLNSIKYEQQLQQQGQYQTQPSYHLHHHHHHQTPAHALHVHSISEDDESIDTDDDWLDQERQYYTERLPVGAQDDKESVASRSSRGGGGGGGGGGSPPIARSLFSNAQSIMEEGTGALPTFHSSTPPPHGHFVTPRNQPTRTSSSGSSSSSASGPSTLLLPPYHQITTSSSATTTTTTTTNNPFLSKRKRTNPLVFSAIMGLTFLGVFCYTQSYATLHNALEQVTLLTQERRRVHLQFRDVERDIQRLQRRLLELDQVQEEILDGGGGINGRTAMGVESEAYRAVDNREHNGKLIHEMMTLQEKLSVGNTQIGSLQHHVQDVSRRDALQKYGSGIIRVQLELEFPEEYVDHGGGGHPHLHHSAKVKGAKPTTMILEMAPLELMPHSVYMFLEMVHAGLFDGCSFVLMAMHMIKLAPLPYDGSSASAKVRSFTKHGLETVAFREYSPEYPHEQYTVAFAADGSPSFYINTQDNTEIHVGEPCFAKIVSGFETVERLAAQPTRGGIWYRRRIGLKQARIL